MISTSNCTFCGFTVGVLTTNAFVGWEPLDLSACCDKTQCSQNKSSYITERAIKAQERKEREKEREVSRGELTPRFRLLKQWILGLEVMNSLKRWERGSFCCLGDWGPLGTAEGEAEAGGGGGG